MTDSLIDIYGKIIKASLTNDEKNLKINSKLFMEYKDKKEVAKHLLAMPETHKETIFKAYIYAFNSKKSKSKSKSLRTKLKSKQKKL